MLKKIKENAEKNGPVITKDKYEVEDTYDVEDFLFESKN